MVLSRLPASSRYDVIGVISNYKPLARFNVLFPAAVYRRATGDTRGAFNRFFAEIDNLALRAFGSIINFPISRLAAVFCNVAATINITVSDYLRSGGIF